MDFLKSEKIPQRFESDSYNDLFGLALVHISLSINDENKKKDFYYCKIFNNDTFYFDFNMEF